MITNDPVGTAIVFLFGIVVGIGLPLFCFIGCVVVDDAVRNLNSKRVK